MMLHDSSVPPLPTISHTHTHKAKKTCAFVVMSIAYKFDQVIWFLRHAFWDYMVMKLSTHFQLNNPDAV